jgi:hypothetical protein
VTVTLLDYNTKQVITTFDLKKADPSKNQPSVNKLQANFLCEAHSSIQFNAQYTPSIWSTDIGKIFESNQIWNVSQALAAAPADTKNLNFIVTFPADFVGVPDLIEGIND